jgi:hypothetical protein
LAFPGAPFADVQIHELMQLQQCRQRGRLINDQHSQLAQQSDVRQQIDSFVNTRTFEEEHLQTRCDCSTEMLEPRRRHADQMEIHCRQVGQLGELGQQSIYRRFSSVCQPTFADGAVELNVSHETPGC